MILTMPVSRLHNINITLTQYNPDDQLEEWINVQNTKSQYSKQLRNFLKVRILFFLKSK